MRFCASSCEQTCQNSVARVTRLLKDSGCVTRAEAGKISTGLTPPGGKEDWLCVLSVELSSPHWLPLAA
jgi:hypothetical protein